MEKRVYRFRDFQLEPDERRLSEAGKPIALTPKVFDTLVLLVDRAGHVVSKEELIRLLWPRGFVDESNLTKHIWLIRRALGEGEHGSQFIETVPKLGYRFVAPVTTDEAPAAPAPEAVPVEEPARPALNGPTKPPGRFRTHAWLLGGGLAGLLALAIAWRVTQGQMPGPPPADPCARSRLSDSAICPTTRRTPGLRPR